jgi:hypothetical protein
VDVAQAFFDRATHSGQWRGMVFVQRQLMFDLGHVVSLSRTVRGPFPPVAEFRIAAVSSVLLTGTRCQATVRLLSTGRENRPEAVFSLGKSPDFSCFMKNRQDPLSRIARVAETIVKHCGNP